MANKAETAGRVIKCAVVGLGRSGVGIHIKLLSSNRNYLVVGVFDTDFKRAREYGKSMSIKSYHTLVNIAQDNDIELVVIATPTKTHYSIALDMLKAKKHVVLEKPITSTIEEARTLEACSNRVGRYLVPFFNFRFVPEFDIIKSVINDKLIGSVYLIKRTVSYYNRRDDWQSLSSEGGGILNAAVIHHLDQVLQLTKSKPIQIFSDIRKLVSKGDAPDHCKVMMKFKDRTVVDLEVSWAEAVSMDPWIIFGTKGMIQQIGNAILCKWFVDDEVLPEDKGSMSYLSHEKIHWHTKSFSLPEDYASGIDTSFYSKLYDALIKQSKTPVEMQSVIKTMDVLDRLEGLSEL